MTGTITRAALSRLISIAALVATVNFFTGCGSSTPDAPNPQAQYAAAVADAASVTPAKISRYLTPIVNENTNLIWENGPGSRLLVATLAGSWAASYKCTDPAGCAGQSCKEGNECPYKFDAWITVVPELKDFFRGSSPQPMRVAQLMGLPPDYATPGNPNETKYVMEMWVRPADLFRPCPDPEITDTVCETGFPPDLFRKFDPAKRLMASEGAADEKVFRSYTGWFGNRKKYIYNYPYPAPDPTSRLPYPWTRLGYTYDWGNANHTGLSEFVLNGKRDDGLGASVKIKSVTDTAAYFAPTQ